MQRFFDVSRLLKLVCVEIAKLFVKLELIFNLSLKFRPVLVWVPRGMKMLLGAVTFKILIVFLKMSTFALKRNVLDATLRSKPALFS